MKTVGANKQDELRLAMQQLLDSYTRAFQDLDASKVISHYINSPEFTLINDGKMLNYHDVETEIRSLFTNMTHFEGGYDDPLITVINDDLVSVKAHFHEALTFFGGQHFDMEGDVTWMARRVGDQFKFIYGHAYHKQKPN
jgi:ketosteroid isomerase-like protein